MSIQIIMRDGMPEYAILPWDEYQALLKAGDKAVVGSTDAVSPSALPGLDELPSMREAKGITQEALARSVGISPAYLALIESGARDPDDAIRRALARAMEIPGWEREA